MGFSVPPRLRLERWALTPPFHPCPALPEMAAGPLPSRPLQEERGGLFSVALSVGTPRGVASRVYLQPNRSYAASRPSVFGLSSLPNRSGRAILRPSKIKLSIDLSGTKSSGAPRANHSRPRFHSLHFAAHLIGRRRALPRVIPAVLTFLAFQRFNESPLPFRITFRAAHPAAPRASNERLAGSGTMNARLTASMAGP